MPGQIGDHICAAVGASHGPTTDELTIKLLLTVTAQGLHVCLSPMHVRKQRGRPPSSEGGNIQRRYRSGTVIRYINQVFQHHIAKSYGHRSCIRYQHVDCVPEFARQDPNHQFSGIKGPKIEHVRHKRCVKSSSVSWLISFEGRMQNVSSNAAFIGHPPYEQSMLQSAIKSSLVRNRNTSEPNRTKQRNTEDSQTA